MTNSKKTKPIERMSKGYYISVNDSYIDQPNKVEIIDKINEIIDRINELHKEEVEVERV